MKPLFEVTTDNDLIALNRALLEAKFSGNACDQDVPESALIAAMANRVASRLASIRPEWKNWFQLDSGRREWRASIVFAISRRAWWSGARTEDRAEFAKVLLAPFLVDDSLVSRFIEEVNTALQSCRWYSVWRRIDGSTIRLAVVRPAVDNHKGIVILSGDGMSVLYQNADEANVTEWLSQNGFTFVFDDILSGSSVQLVDG